MSYMDMLHQTYGHLDRSTWTNLDRYSAGNQLEQKLAVAQFCMEAQDEEDLYDPDLPYFRILEQVGMTGNEAMTLYLYYEDLRNIFYRLANQALQRIMREPLELDHWLGALEAPEDAVAEAYEVLDNLLTNPELDLGKTLFKVGRFAIAVESAYGTVSLEAYRILHNAIDQHKQAQRLAIAEASYANTWDYDDELMDQLYDSVGWESGRTSRVRCIKIIETMEQIAEVYSQIAWEAILPAVIINRKPLICFQSQEQQDFVEQRMNFLGELLGE